MHSIYNIHTRDLKMQNIMLTGNLRQIKIVDLGLGNWCDSENLLRTNCGSPEYAAPELYQTGRGYGPQVDLWSLGVVIYVMVTGCLPFAVLNASDMTSAEKRDCLLKQIDKGFQTQHKAALCNMSQDCIHVVSRLLTVSDQERITMEELMFHPWVTCRQTKMLKHSSYKKLATDDFYRIINKIVRLMGITQDDVLDTIKSAPTGSVGGIFNILLLRQHEKDLDRASLAISRKLSMQQAAASNALIKPHTRASPRSSRMDDNRSRSARASIQNKPRAVSHYGRVHSKLKPCQQDDGKHRARTSTLKPRVPYYDDELSSSSSDSLIDSSTSSWSDKTNELMAFHHMVAQRNDSQKLISEISCCAHNQKNVPVPRCRKDDTFHHPSRSSNIDHKQSSYFKSPVTRKSRAKTGNSNTPTRKPCSQSRSNGQVKVSSGITSSVPNHAKLTLSHLSKRLPPKAYSPVSDSQQSRQKTVNHRAREKEMGTQVVQRDKSEKVSCSHSPLLYSTAKDTGHHSRDKLPVKPRTNAGLCASLVTKIRSKGSSIDRLSKTAPRVSSNQARQRSMALNKWKHLSTVMKQVKLHLSSDHMGRDMSSEETASLERTIQKLASTYKSGSACNSHDFEPRLKVRNIKSQTNQKSSQSRVPSPPSNGNKTKPTRTVSLARVRSPHASPRNRKGSILERVKKLSSSLGTTLPSDKRGGDKTRAKSSFTAGLVNHLSGVKGKAVNTAEYTDTADLMSPTLHDTPSSKKYMTNAYDSYDNDLPTRAHEKQYETVSKCAQSRRHSCKTLVSERRDCSAHREIGSAVANHSRRAREHISAATQDNDDSPDRQIPESLLDTWQGKEVTHRKQSRRQLSQSRSRNRLASPGKKPSYSSLGYIESMAQVFNPALAHKRSAKPVRSKSTNQHSLLSPRYNCKSHTVVFKPSVAGAKERTKVDKYYIDNMFLPECKHVESTRRSYSCTRNTRSKDGLDHYPSLRVACKKPPSNPSSYFSNPKSSRSATRGISSTKRRSMRIAWAESPSPDHPHLIGMSRVQKQHDPGPL